MLPVYSLILLFCNSSPKDAKPKLVPNQNIPAVYPSREEHVMVAQSLEQDGSWSLESSQGWLMLVGHETSAGRHDTKPTLVAAFDFISCLVGWGLQEGKHQGSVPAHTSLPPCTCQIQPHSSSQQVPRWFCRNAPSGRQELSCSAWHCSSCASTGRPAAVLS